MEDLNSSTQLILGYFNGGTWADIDAGMSLISLLIILPGMFLYLVSKWKLGQYNRRKKSILKKKHVIVCGLGTNNRVYLDSELKDNYKDIIVIEQDKNNLYIEKYKQNGLGIEIGNANDYQLLKSLNIGQAEHILVSTGNDMTNLEITTQILQIDKDVKIYLHVEDKSLRHFHKEQGILEGSSIKLYSYYEEASRELFERFDIDGQDNSIINTNQNFSIAVIGNTNLAYEVISQACIMGQLPNENLLTIYCIDKNDKEFKQNVELNYTQIGKIHTVNLQFVCLDVNSKDFYENELWNDNLTNIIICFENEQTNLDIASNLAEITYINEIADSTLKTNIIIAMFNDYNLGNKIKTNNTVFKNFNTFGNIKQINNKNIIINEERDTQAKCVDFIYNYIQPKIVNYALYEFIYTDLDTEKFNTIDLDWKKLSYFKQESNRAVADHIKTKLKFIGLKFKKSKIVFDTLYLKNQQLYKDLVDKNMEILLAKNEHQRWNTFHYLNGFQKTNLITKQEKNELKKIHELKKLHMCLVSFEEFKLKSDELVDKGYELGSFEGYDFMINQHIPFILAKSGFEIFKMEKIL